MTKMQNLERIEVDSVAALRQWFIQNHAQKESIWLVTYKKNVPDKYVTIQEVLSELPAPRNQHQQRIDLN